MSNLEEIESHTNVAAHKIVLKLFQSCSGHGESAPSRRDAVFYTGGIGAHRGNANHQVLRRVGRYLYSPLVHTSPKLEGAEDGSVPNLESEGQREARVDDATTSDTGTIAKETKTSKRETAREAEERCVRPARQMAVKIPCPCAASWR